MPYQRFVKEGEYEMFRKFRFVTINLMSAKEKAIQDGLTLFLGKFDVLEPRTLGMV
jgi:hypothetical protein